MHKLSVVVVEDHDDLRLELSEHLAYEGMDVVGIDTGDELNAILRSKMVHAIVLDLNLPYEDGLSILQRVRNAHPNVVIVVLTGRVRGIDRQVGYQRGADVYLTKPAKPTEVSQVIQNLCRRLASVEPSPQWRFDSFRMVLHSPSGNTADLTVSENVLLHELALAGELLQLHRLVPLLGEIDLPDSVNKVRIEQVVSRLRQKIADLHDGSQSIKALRGRGYKLCIPVAITG
ncbi:MAG: response regulator transcription factor [Betaproteobacteria bacterium]